MINKVGIKVECCNEITLVENSRQTTWEFGKILNSMF